MLTILKIEGNLKKITNWQEGNNHLSQKGLER